MDIAIVTGAETPLGLRLIERLIQQGCRVHGIGNNFSKVTFADRHFVAHAVDLTDLEALRGVAAKILEDENRVDILIHAIDVTPGGAFEKLPVGNLEAVLKIGLLGPVMLTRLMLPNLLRFRGRLINIIPANKSGSPASAVNALLEGGLREMNRALFDSARNAGLRVTNLILRQNTAPAPGDSSDRQFAQSRIDPAHVARTVEQLLDTHATNVPDEITLHPPLSPEAQSELPGTSLPLDPYSAVVLPPKEYCPPDPEPIPTEKPQRVDRLIPYTDDEMEDKIAAAVEDFEAHPERYLDEPKQQPKRPAPSGDDSRQPSQNDGGGGGSGGKNKRRRRRGGRNRKNRGGPDDSNHGGPQHGGQGDSKQNQSPKAPKERPSEAKSEKARSEQGPQQDQGEQPKRSRRGGRNRKADDSPKSDRPQDAKPQTDDRPRQQAPESGKSGGEPKPSGKKPSAESGKPPAQKAAKKKPAKKAAKKAAKKKVAKKAAKKRTAKKDSAPQPPADA